MFIRYIKPDTEVMRARAALRAAERKHKIMEEKEYKEQREQDRKEILAARKAREVEIQRSWSEKKVELLKELEGKVKEGRDVLMKSTEKTAFIVCLSCTDERILRCLITEAEFIYLHFNIYLARDLHEFVRQNRSRVNYTDLVFDLRERRCIIGCL